MKNILVTVTILFFTSISVFAFTEDEQINSANYLAKKTFIKDFSNKPEEYRINDNISRKEAIKIIANVAYLKIDDKCEGKFKDVINDWGCKYIEAALKAGFIKESDKFYPYNNITNAEVLKLIFKARKLERKFNTGDWVNDYLNSAKELGLLIGDEIDGNSYAKRGWIFNVIFNSYNNSYELNDDYCVSDDDCTIVLTKCSCDCGIPVNKNSEDKYTSFREELCKDYNGKMCKMRCESNTRCLNNKCIIDSN